MERKQTPWIIDELCTLQLLAGAEPNQLRDAYVVPGAATFLLRSGDQKARRAHSVLETPQDR